MVVYLMREVLLGLVCTPSIGWKTIKRMLSQEKGTDEMFEWSSDQFREAFPFLSAVQLQHLQTPLAARVEKQKQALRKFGADFVTVFDAQYPQHLAETQQAPWVLFYKGNLSLLQQPAIAVVGSRKATPYGYKATDLFTKPLINAGFTIISGLAKGIDTYSHQAALDFDGKTVAVLGNSLDHCYPALNRSLQVQIAQKGCLLSEFPISTPPRPPFFPLRNRIIAGLAIGTLVIEAQKQSGSLLTAFLALEFGREVFSVPGSIFDPHSTGTNELIQKQGAKLVLRPEDILDELEGYYTLRDKTLV